MINDLTTALDGVTVVDLSGANPNGRASVAAGFAGKLLADLGADVVMIEPATGSPLRTHLLWDWLGGGKRSVVADDPAPWIDSADVILVERGTPTPSADHAIVIELSPFGRTGPYAHWQSSDLVTWALGGYLHFTGSPDREPIHVPGSQAQLHAGAHAALAALVGLHERVRSGSGQRVEVSDVEATLTAHAWLVSSWAACGVVLGRQPPDLIHCTDGMVYVMRIVPKDELFVMIDRPDLAAEQLSRDVPTWHANIPRIFEAVAQWAADKTVAEVVELGQLLRIAVTPVLDAAGVLADDHLAAREFWESDGHASGPVFPGQPYRFERTPAGRKGRAPLLNEHASLEPPSRPLVSPAVVTKAGQPLAGLRVVEVTTNWAGPVAGRFLADLGADSIKVEWATRPATRSMFWAGPGQELLRQSHHRSLYFNEMNRNKRGVCIDLSKPDGREAFLGLVRTADIVIENNSARVMPNLGLGWDDLRAVNPRLIMVSMSGYGATGPHRDWVAYGANIETTSSLTSTTGYSDGQLARTTLFYADPVSGNYAALAAMAALRHRERTGEGQWIDISLNECGVTFCAHSLVEAQLSGSQPPTLGNRDQRVAPQGVYRCMGADSWLALTIDADEAWRALATEIGRPDLTSLDVVSRGERHDEIDDAITAWTSTREQYESVHALQRAGVAAAPVLANWQVLADPHLHARNMYETSVHPVIGAYPATTWPWRFERTSARIRTHAPLFAEHNREVLGEAGLDDAAIAALYESGTTSDEPIPAG